MNCDHDSSTLLAASVGSRSTNKDWFYQQQQPRGGHGNLQSEFPMPRYDSQEATFQRPLSVPNSVNIHGDAALLNVGSDQNKPSMAGTVGYGTRTPGALDIVGGTTKAGEERVVMHSDGGYTVNAHMGAKFNVVSGDVNMGTKTGRVNLKAPKKGIHLDGDLYGTGDKLTADYKHGVDVNAGTGNITLRSQGNVFIRAQEGVTTEGDLVVSNGSVDIGEKQAVRFTGQNNSTSGSISCGLLSDGLDIVGHSSGKTSAQTVHIRAPGGVSVDGPLLLSGGWSVDTSSGSMQFKHGNQVKWTVES
jgi:hypothetical protein